MRIGVKLALIAALIVAVAGVYGFSRGLVPSPGRTAPSAEPAGEAIPVEVAVAEAQDVPIIVRGLGSATAFNTVSVKSRVQGNIVRVAFREGQEVHAGDLLFQIDPRPYQAVLDQAEAALAKDQATLANARANLARYADLLKRNFAPEQEFANQQALVAEDEAAARSDQARVEAARLNVDYAAVRSPIDGVTGIRQVDLGNLVQADDGHTLVVVTQVKPIYVVFTLPEADIAEARDAMARGPLTTIAFDPADEHPIAEGTLKLIDNQVDQGTGTVKLKAEFANARERLWPGQFVNAHLVLEQVKHGVTIPAAAVQIGPKGSYVYLVRPDDTVEHRDVAVRQTEKDRALVASGINVGERVVTLGQLRLREGARVAVSESGPVPSPVAAR